MESNVLRNITAVLCVTCGLFLVGCGSAKETVHSVTGKVTLDGQPLEGANLTFLPTAGGTESGLATSDASGNYKVNNLRGGEGLAIGKYRVIVSKMVGADGKPIQSAPGENAPAMADLTETIPQQYADFNNSPLFLDVTDAGATGNFDLKSK